MVCSTSGGKVDSLDCIVVVALCKGRRQTSHKKFIEEIDTWLSVQVFDKAAERHILPVCRVSVCKCQGREPTSPYREDNNKGELNGNRFLAGRSQANEYGIRKKKFKNKIRSKYKSRVCGGDNEALI